LTGRTFSTGEINTSFLNTGNKRTFTILKNPADATGTELQDQPTVSLTAGGQTVKGVVQRGFAAWGRVTLNGPTVTVRPFADQTKTVDIDNDGISFMTVGFAQQVTVRALGGIYTGKANHQLDSDMQGQSAPDSPPWSPPIIPWTFMRDDRITGYWVPGSGAGNKGVIWFFDNPSMVVPRTYQSVALTKVRWQLDFLTNVIVKSSAKGATGYFQEGQTAWFLNGNGDVKTENNQTTWTGDGAGIGLQAGWPAQWKIPGDASPLPDAWANATETANDRGARLRFVAS
jgi:hypothetical protein